MKIATARQAGDVYHLADNVQSRFIADLEGMLALGAGGLERQGVHRGG
jgi:hypothetical protein